MDRLNINEHHKDIEDAAFNKIQYPMTIPYKGTVIVKYSEDDFKIVITLSTFKDAKKVIRSINKTGEIYI